MSPLLSQSYGASPLPISVLQPQQGIKLVLNPSQPKLTMLGLSAVCPDGASMGCDGQFLMQALKDVVSGSGAVDSVGGAGSRGATWLFDGPLMGSCSGPAPLARSVCSWGSGAWCGDCCHHSFQVAARCGCGPCCPRCPLTSADEQHTVASRLCKTLPDAVRGGRFWSSCGKPQRQRRGPQLRQGPQLGWLQPRLTFTASIRHS